MSKRKINVRSQHGMVLIMLVFIVGLAATAFVLKALNSNTVKIERDKKTAAALAEAKAAIIGWSVKHQTMPGVLPCPDTNNDGSSDPSGANCVAYIGRLPWRTLGIGDLRDSDGQCLWYALSPIFRNTISVASRVGSPLNSTTAGTITLQDDAGNPFPSPPNPVIAVIVSPGAALAGQDRTGAGTSVCGGNTVAASYLETLAGVNNATGNVIGVNYTFVLGQPSNAFNDHFTYVSAEQLFQPLRKRIANEIRGPDTPPTAALRQFYNNLHYYPWAADAAGNQQVGSTSGFVPYNDPNYGHPTLGNWLLKNGWYAWISYRVGNDFKQGTEIAYPQTCGTGCLTVRAQTTPAEVVVGGGAASWRARVCLNTATMSCPDP